MRCVPTAAMPWQQIFAYTALDATRLSLHLAVSRRSIISAFHVTCLLRLHAALTLRSFTVLITFANPPTCTLTSKSFFRHVKKITSYATLPETSQLRCDLRQSSLRLPLYAYLMYLSAITVHRWWPSSCHQNANDWKRHEDVRDSK